MLLKFCIEKVKKRDFNPPSLGSVFIIFNKLVAANCKIYYIDLSPSKILEETSYYSSSSSPTS